MSKTHITDDELNELEKLHAELMEHSWDQGEIQLMDATPRLISEVRRLNKVASQAINMGAFITTQNDHKYIAGYVPLIKCETASCAASHLPELRNELWRIEGE